MVSGHDVILLNADAYVAGLCRTRSLRSAERCSSTFRQGDCKVTMVNGK